MKKLLICLFIFLMIITGCKAKEKGPVTTTEEISEYSLNLEDLGLAFDSLGACIVETTTENDEIQKIVVRSNNEDWLGLITIEYLTYEEGQTFDTVVETLVNEHDSYYLEENGSIYYAYNTIFEKGHYIVLSNIYSLENKYAIVNKYIPSIEINIKPSKKYIYIPYFAYQEKYNSFVFDDAPEIYQGYYHLIYADGQDLGLTFEGFSIGSSSFTDYVDGKIKSIDGNHYAKKVEINEINTVYSVINNTYGNTKYVEYAFSDSKAIHMYFLEVIQDDHYIVTFDAMFKSLHKEMDPEITDEEEVIVEEENVDEGETIEIVEEIDNYRESEYDEYLNQFIYNQEKITYDQTIDKLNKKKTPVYVNPYYEKDLNNIDIETEVETYGWTTTYTLLDKETFDNLYSIYSATQKCSYIRYEYIADFFKSVVDLKDENVIYKKSGLFNSDKELQYIVFVRDDDTFKHVCFYYVGLNTYEGNTYKSLGYVGNYSIFTKDIVLNTDVTIGEIDENLEPIYLFIPNDDKGSSFTEGWTTDYAVLSKEEYKTYIDKADSIDSLFSKTYDEIIKEVFNGDTRGTIYTKNGKPIEIILTYYTGSYRKFYYFGFNENGKLKIKGGQSAD